ncbi:MAG: SusD/RagB family nutrient-binding outer membrane lipoprotein [Mangrovibacterium sp.]
MKNKIPQLLAGLLVFTACSLDINKDPNSLAELESAKSLLPSAELTIAANLMGWNTGFGGGYWSQYMAQSPTASQFKSLEDYIETDYSYLWSEFTAGALNDLKEIKEISAEKQTPSYAYIAEILQIFAWQVMTDTWGDVPYSEALQGGDNTNPKFDKGEDIYADLLVRVEAVLAVDVANLSDIDASYDLIFNGDLEQWKAFASALKLKLLIRQSETADYNNASVLSFVESTTFTSAGAIISGKIFSDVDGKRHPMAEFQAGGANFVSLNVIASKTLLSYLENNNDPRLASIYSKAADGTYRGALQGDYNSTEDVDSNGTADKNEKYSGMQWAYNMDLPLLSYWEQEFFIAEIYARANNMASAKIHYDKAVAASLAAHGLSASITAAGEYAEFVPANLDEALELIGLQKWVAYCKYQHHEAFLERNRLKYPALDKVNVAADRVEVYNNFPVGKFTVSVQGRSKLNGKLPASPTFPNSVLSRNSNAPSQKANIGENVWWNKKEDL